MRSRRPFRQSDRRGALPAALALLALITQLLIPAAALAQEANAGARTVVICTLEGVQTVTVPAGDNHDHGFAGLKCHDCVMASIAVVAPGDATAVPVRYPAESRVVVSGHARPRAQSRAPPRPPSTAPPAFRTA